MTHYLDPISPLRVGRRLYATARELPILNPDRLDRAVEAVVTCLRRPVDGLPSASILLVEPGDRPDDLPDKALGLLDRLYGVPDEALVEMAACRHLLQEGDDYPRSQSRRIWGLTNEVGIFHAVDARFDPPGDYGFEYIDLDDIGR